MTSLPEVRSGAQLVPVTPTSSSIHTTAVAAIAAAVHLCFQHCEFRSEITDRGPAVSRKRIIHKTFQNKL